MLFLQHPEYKIELLPEAQKLIKEHYRAKGEILTLNIEGGGCSGFKYIFNFEPLEVFFKEVFLKIEKNGNKLDVTQGVSNTDKLSKLDTSKSLTMAYVKDLLINKADYIYVGIIEDDLNTDKVREKFLILCAIEKNTAEMLKNAQIDYRGNLMGKALVVINPNAEKSCGCGASFS